MSLRLFQMIKKDLKKYSKIFEQKDRLSQSKASKVCPALVYKCCFLRPVCSLPALPVTLNGFNQQYN